MKYSVAINRQIDTGAQLNALAHVAVGLAHLAPSEMQAMRMFKDVEERPVGLMSDHPFIVLEAVNSNKLRQAYLSALDLGLSANAFVIDMKDGNPVDQEETVSRKKSDDYLFVAFGCWGEDDVVRDVMKRFSLYR